MEEVEEDRTSSSCFKLLMTTSRSSVDCQSWVLSMPARFRED